MAKTLFVNDHHEVTSAPNAPDRWVFHTDFDLNKDGSTYNYPFDPKTDGRLEKNDAALKALTEEALVLITKVFAIQCVIKIRVECHCLTVTKSDSMDWNDILPRIRQDFKSAYEVIVSFD